MTDAPRRGSLVVVGTGIKLVSHATTEAIACMQRADRLFYLVLEPATEAWIRRLNPSAVTLDDCYAVGKPRQKTYREMTDRMLAAVREGHQVCAAFYGHPGVLVDASHDAIRRARREGFDARMLPGVSSEASLFADLGVDPGDSGCQSFEATNFLMFKRRFDPTSALILLQVGVLGEPSIRIGMTCRPERLKVLTNVLRKHYPERHPIVLYEAPQFPICRPGIKRVPLAKLPAQTVWPMTTLYVPPIPERSPDARVMRWIEGA